MLCTHYQLINDSWCINLSSNVNSFHPEIILLTTQSGIAWHGAAFHLFVVVVVVAVSAVCLVSTGWTLYVKGHGHGNFVLVHVNFVIPNRLGKVSKQPKSTQYFEICLWMWIFFIKMIVFTSGCEMIAKFITMKTPVDLLYRACNRCRWIRSNWSPVFFPSIV